MAQYLIEDTSLKNLGDSARRIKNTTGNIPFNTILSTFSNTAVVDTSDATATASSMLAGSSGYVDGAKVEGTIQSKSATTITPGTSAKTAIAAGTYAAGRIQVAGDSNLVAANIAKGKTIFGVTGSFEGSGGSGPVSGIDTSDATAGSGDILSGRTAYVNGQKITGSIAEQDFSQYPATISVSSTGVITSTTMIPEGYYTSNSKATTKNLSTMAGGTFKNNTTLNTRGKYMTGNIVIDVPTNSTGIDTSDATATADCILDGYSAYARGQRLTGIMQICSLEDPVLTLNANTGVVTAEVTIDEPGYYPEHEKSSQTLNLPTLAGGTYKANQTIATKGKFMTGNIVVNVPASGIDTSDATATSEDIRQGYSAYVKGQKISGSMPEPPTEDLLPVISVNSNTGLITATTSIIDAGYYPSDSFSVTQQLSTMAGGTYTSNQTLNTKGKFMTGNITINVPASGGTNTSDATAVASDIMSGKTAYIAGGKVTGTLSAANYYFNDSAPSDSFGSNGDLCFVTVYRKQNGSWSAVTPSAIKSTLESSLIKLTAAAKPTYTITKSLGNSTINNSATQVEEGKSFTATITPSTGYKINSVVVAMGGKTVGTSANINITNVTGNISITVNTSLISYSITNNLTNVTSNNSNTSINYGSTYTATLSAASGYNMGTVTIKMGNTDITSSAYTSSTRRISISNVTGNITITANASITAYTITQNLTNITTSNSATGANYGSSFQATLSPSTGYDIDTVTVTMGGTTLTNAYNSSTKIVSISSVTGNIVITAKGKIKSYTISKTLNQSTCSNSATSINYGSSYVATITPNTGYNLNSVTVTMGGTNITSSAYTSSTRRISIGSVTGNIVITVTTSRITYSVTNTLTNITTSNSATTVNYGASYTATLTAATGYSFGTVSVTMGGTNITSTAYSNGNINIANVTGAIVVTASGITIPTVITVNYSAGADDPVSSSGVDNDIYYKLKTQATVSATGEQHYLSGSGQPSASTGSIGDIYEVEG